MLPDQRIAPTTAAVANLQINCSEADKVLFALCGSASLIAAEVINFSVANSTGGKTTAYSTGSTAAQLTATNSSLLLEGGIEYIIDKSASVGAVGLDVNFKPRIGPQ